MVVDIVVTVLSWTSLASPKVDPQDEKLLLYFVEILMYCSAVESAQFLCANELP